jgi:hypothetical protein
MCLSHLLGFLLSVMIVSVMTPAVTPSAMRNSSILAARWSLSSAYLVIISSKAVVNIVVDVCSLHFLALVL